MKYIYISEDGQEIGRQISWRYPRNGFEREVLAACRADKWPSRQVRNAWLDIQAHMRRNEQYKEYVSSMVKAAKEKNANSLTMTLKVLAEICADAIPASKAKKEAVRLSKNHAYSTEND